jgi:FeS assembly SUF system regulator
MLRIGKLTDYATVVMAQLSRHSGECWSASQVAEATRLEVPTVAKVLKMLAKADLIDSVRGVNGGYRLARGPERVTVASIIRAMEGPIALTECGLEPGLCSREHECDLRGNWQRIGETVERALEAMTLADLASPRGVSLRLVATAGSATAEAAK